VAEFMTLDGKRITLRNAEELVRARYARARVQGYTGNDRKRYYLVWEGGYSVGGNTKRLGEGDTKPQAWKDAAENIAYREQQRQQANNTKSEGD
jgi:hypothetical protein